jgi:hypothetical protein
MEDEVDLPSPALAARMLEARPRLTLLSATEKRQAKR